MAKKSSDDPMDLGGFMQNFVLNNPFKDMPDIAMAEQGPGMKTYDPRGLSPPLSDHITRPESTSSSRSSHSNTNNCDEMEGLDPGRKTGVVFTDHIGQVVDTPQGHVGSNVSYAAALKFQQASWCRINVQTWLKANYCYVPHYSGINDTKALLQSVTSEFPQVNGIILSKVMTFTFPDCSKVTNINGCHGYRGLISKPQPEDYCDLELLKAVSHAKTSGSVSQAAELYSVPESAVASLYYWHTEHDEHADSGDDKDNYQGDTKPAAAHKSGRKTVKKFRRRKRRRLPKDFCDPENLTDIEDDAPSEPKRRSSRDTQDLMLDKIKQEVENIEYGDTVKDQAKKNTRVCSLLRNLLKGKPGEVLGADSSRALAADQVPQLVIIKPEPIDSDYEDVEEPRTRPRTRKRSSTQEQHVVNLGFQQEQSYPLNMSTSRTKSHEDHDGENMKEEIVRLQNLLRDEELHSQQLEKELLSSRKQVSGLKCTMRKQELSMIELVQDFASLREQFGKLTDKFTVTLTNLAEEQTPVLNTVDTSVPEDGKNSRKRKFHGSKWKRHELFEEAKSRETLTNVAGDEETLQNTDSLSVPEDGKNSRKWKFHGPKWNHHDSEEKKSRSSLNS